MGNVCMQQSVLLEFSLSHGYVFPSSSDPFFRLPETDVFVYFVSEDESINREKDAAAHPCAFFVCAHWE